MMRATTSHNALRAFGRVLFFQLTVCSGLFLASCGSVEQPRLSKRYPYKVGVLPVKTDPFPDKSMDNSEDLAVNLKVQYASSDLTTQLRESLAGVFEDAVILTDESAASDVDLVLRSDLRYDGRVETTGNWVQSFLLFAVGGPFSWLVDDRQYSCTNNMSCTWVLPGHLAGSASNPWKLETKPQSNPVSMDFWQRADGGVDYLLGCIWVPVFLATESESVQNNLSVAMGKNLADDVARDCVQKDEELRKGAGLRSRAEFELRDAVIVSSGGSFVLKAEWDHVGINSRGIKVSYKVGNGQFTQVKSLDQTRGEGKASIFSCAVHLSANPNDLVRIKVQQDGGSEAVRTYTVRVPAPKD